MILQILSYIAATALFAFVTLSLGQFQGSYGLVLSL